MAFIRLPWALTQVMFVSLALALGQIRARKIRSLLTVLGIVIAVAAVTATVGALTGMKKSVTDQFAQTGINRMDVWPSTPDSGPKKNAPLASINFRPQYFDTCLRDCPAFTRVTAVCYDDQPVRHGSRAIEVARLWGVEPDWPRIQNRAVLSGRFFSAAEARAGQRVCVVTPEVRDKLMLDRECAGETIVIGRTTYTVVGVIEPEPQVQIMWSGPQRPQIAVPFGTIHKSRTDYMEESLTVASTGLVQEAQAQIRFFLRKVLRLLPGEPDTFGVWNGEGNLASFNSTALAITAVASGIVGISLLVGGVGIMNIMLVSVTERTREIGLRKALGARPSAIMLQFLIEAVILCLVGGLVGIALGQVLTVAVRKVPGIGLEAAAVPGWAIALSLGFSAGVGLFFGMFPAVKAALLHPIEALRHE